MQKIAVVGFPYYDFIPPVRLKELTARERLVKRGTQWYKEVLCRNHDRVIEETKVRLARDPQPHELRPIRKRPHGFVIARSYPYVVVARLHGPQRRSLQLLEYKGWGPVTRQRVRIMEETANTFPTTEALNTAYHQLLQQVDFNGEELTLPAGEHNGLSVQGPFGRGVLGSYRVYATLQNGLLIMRDLRLFHQDVTRDVLPQLLAAPRKSVLRRLVTLVSRTQPDVTDESLPEELRKRLEKLHNNMGYLNAHNAGQKLTRAINHRTAWVG